MEIKLKITFFIYTGLLSSAVCANIRHIRYRTGNRQFSTEDKDCCVRKDENEYKAVKIPLGNESEICYGLERDWLLDKRYDDGYFYIEKEKVVEIFKPPIPVITHTYFWTLPISFETGAIITIFFTSPLSWTRFEINLLDREKDDLPQNLLDLPSKPIMHHIYFRQDYNFAGVDTFTPDQGWQESGIITQPCPIEFGITYKITFESHTGFIRTVIDDHPYFELPHIIPPVNAATLQIRNNVTAPWLIHNITMNGRVKKNFT